MSKIIRSVKFLFTRAVIFYALAVLVSTTFVDYKKVKFDVQLRHLNRIMPTSFKPLVQIIGRKDLQHKDKLLAQYILFYEKVAQYFPGHADSYGMLGYCYYHFPNINRSKEMFLRASEIEPDVFWYPYNLGLILFKQGQYADAAKYLEKAVKSDAQKTFAFMSSSKFIYQGVTRDNPAYAQAHPQRFINARARATLLLLLSYLKLGNHAAMQAEINEAMRSKRAEATDLLFFAGLNSLVQNNFKKAAHYFGECIKKNPQYPDIEHYYQLSLKESQAPEVIRIPSEIKGMEILPF